MTRVKRGVTSLKHRKNVLSQVKGFRNARKSKERQAREALFHAGNHAFAHRKDKKSDFRKLWTVRINAALRPLGHSYSKFIGILKTKNIKVDRKTMATIAQAQPSVFKSFVESVQ